MCVNGIEKNCIFNLNVGGMVDCNDISLTSGSGVSVGIKMSCNPPFLAGFGVTASVDLSYSLLPLSEKNRSISE